MLYIQSKQTLCSAGRFIIWLTSRMRLKLLLILYIDPSLGWFLGENGQSSTVCVCVCSLCRCGIDDTAQYTAVAANTHGQASSLASVIVKSEYCLKQTSYQNNTLPSYSRIKQSYKNSYSCFYSIGYVQRLQFCRKGLWGKVLRIDVQLQNSIQTA